TCAQMLGVVAFSVVWLGVEQPSFGDLPWAVLLYLGVGATAITIWLQTHGQRRIGAAEAAVIYTLEPVWAALFAVILFAAPLGLMSWSGAAVICIATLVSQWPALRQQQKSRGQQHPDDVPQTADDSSAGM